jgi:hypothetical protein
MIATAMVDAERERCGELIDMAASSPIQLD